MVTAAFLRIVFFGTPEFAVPTLNALLASSHVVAGIVTQPDRPRGRGQRLQPAPIKEVAQAHNLPVLEPPRLRDEAFLTSLKELDGELGVVAAYGKILTDSVLQAFRNGLVNVHASLLPKYRGAAPIHRAVMAGETETGITIMRVVKELDAGPMLATVARPIGPDETSVEVELDLARLGAEALVSVIDQLAAGKAIETPQDHTAATYAHKLQKSDGVIDWTNSATAIHNRIRGLHPWPHAHSELNGHRVLLLGSRVEKGAGLLFSTKEPGPFSSPGTVIEAEGDNLRVQTGDGVLRLLRLQLEGRRPVSTREFLAGHRLTPGTKLVRAEAQP